jgi:hypothetical protein
VRRDWRSLENWRRAATVTDVSANLRFDLPLAPRRLWAALRGPEPTAAPEALRNARDARTAVALFALSGAGVLTAVDLGGLGAVLAGVAALQLLTVAAIQVRLARTRGRTGT